MSKLEPFYDVGGITIRDWHGCYDDSWKGVIVDEAFAHPAKFSYGLITRIVDHGLKQGYWNQSSLIGDCFGGVALGGVICGARGLNWIGCELEPRFVDLGNQNLAKHGPLFMHGGATCVKLVQGDSRRFASIVGGVDGLVTSQPFVGARAGTTKSTPTKGGGPCAERVRSVGTDGSCMGDTPGQIGSLKTGNLDAVVTSPPYGVDTDRTRPHGNKSTDGDGGFRNYYSDDPANIGNPTGANGMETYWQAMRQVYEQCRITIRPGGVMACVVKDFVAKSAIVPLCDQTCQLLESVGFQVFERTRCHLVKENRQPGLFGEDVVKTTSRKSFFRRLAEAKGSPEINWEEVIWARTSSPSPSERKP